MPVYSTGKIYNKGSFIKKNDYVIKTVEQSIPLSEGYSAFHLFSEKLIAMHQMQYNYLHIGMVQVALKPATRLGLNTPAIVVVRDKRHNKFHDSDNWVLEKANPPVKQENTKLEEIVEYPDGDVEIRFSKNRITCLNLGRNSTSSIPLSSYEKENINVKNTSDGVSQPEYKVELPSSSRRKSLTPSDMGYEDNNVYGFSTCTQIQTK